MASSLRCLGPVCITSLLAGCGGGATVDFVGASAFTLPDGLSLAQTTGVIDANADVTVSSDETSFTAEAGLTSSPISGADGDGLLFVEPIQPGAETIIYAGFYGPDDAVVYIAALGPSVSGRIATTGDAVWTGEAFVANEVPLGDLSQFTGSARVTADLDAGLVDVDISVAADGFDEIVLSDLEIDSDRFSGTDISVRNSGLTTTPVGTPTNAAVEGFFAGEVASGIAAETAGVFVLEGASGRLAGGFIAEKQDWTMN